MVGLSTPSGEHSHRVAPPPDPSVPTPCREAPAPELPGRFAAARIDRQAAACRQRIVTDRVREEGKCAPPPGFCPGYLPAVWRCVKIDAGFPPESSVRSASANVDRPPPGVEVASTSGACATAMRLG